MKTILLRRTAAVLLFAALFLSLASCRVKHDEAQVAAAAAELIEASYEINGIFFGSGLPFDKDSASSDMKDYYRVSEDSAYVTEEEIREATLKVYSEDYSDFLFEKAFKGYSVNFDPTETDAPHIIYARYLTDSSGLLVRQVDGADKLTLNRTYDTDSIRLTKSRRSSVTVTVTSLVEGKVDCDIELTLVKTGDGWRLDTPTY